MKNPFPKSLSLTCLLFTIMQFGGCASIMAGDSQAVSFTSNPTGARVEIVSAEGEAIHVGNTPFVVELKRGSGYFKGANLTARASASGYPERELAIKSTVGGWYWLNLLFGGVPGMLIVDPITGAMYNFPEEVHIDLTAPSEEVEVSYARPGEKGIYLVLQE